MIINRRLILILFMAIIPFVPLFAETANMDFTNPVAPNNLQVSNDGQKILASMMYNSSSVWYSNDGGTNWECFNSRLYDVNDVIYQSLYPFMAGPEGDKIVVFGIINSADSLHVLYSNDGGNNFVDRSPPIWIDEARNVSFTVDSFYEDTWLIQTRAECYYTFDAGEYWNCVSNVGDSTNLTPPSMIISDPVVSGTYYNLTYYTTYESGTFLSDVKVYRSQRGIYNWELDAPFIELNNQLGTYQSEIKKFLPLSNGNFLAYIEARSETEDWTVDRFVTFNSNGEFLQRSGGEASQQKALFEDQLIPGRIYSASYSHLLVSNDYGLTWEEMTSLPTDESSSINSFYQTPDGSSLYCSIDNHGIYTSIDQGTSWSPVNTFVLPRFHQLYAKSEDIIYTQCGQNWLRRPSGTEDLQTISLTGHPDSTYSLCNIGFVNGDTLIGTAYVYPYSENIPHNRLYGSFDGGETWSFMKDVGEQYYLGLLHSFYSFSSSNRHFVNFQNDFIEYSSDMGFSWETLPEIIYDNHPAQKFLFAHYNGQFYVLARGIYSSEYQIYEFDFENNNWVNKSYPAPMEDVLSMVAGENSLTVVNSEGSIFRSTSTTSWTAIPTPLPLYYYFSHVTNCYVDCVDPFILYHVRFMDDLYVLKDGDYVCYPIELEYPYGLTINHFNSIQYDPERERIWLSTEYGLFWFPVEYVLSAKDQPIKVHPADFNLFTNYPNPFNASTRIQYNLTQPGNVKLDLYDITGRLVKTLENTYKYKGQNQYFLNATGMASGTYFLQLRAGDKTLQRRITLVK